MFLTPLSSPPILTNYLSQRPAVSGWLPVFRPSVIKGLINVGDNHCTGTGTLSAHLRHDKAQVLLSNLDLDFGILEACQILN